jgi:hydrogenase maturation factor
MEADKIGKIDETVFRAFLMQRLGAHDPRVRVGPRTGVDAAVLEIGGKAVVVAEDPIFPAAGLPLETFGWFTVHIGASDVAVMGVPPSLATYSLLMPPRTPDGDFRTIVDSIHEAALELGISIVGGHTGYYPVVNVPIIGGITVIGVGEMETIVTPGGAQAGDAVLMTKGPAIEATGLLAVLYEASLREAHGDAVAEAALARCGQITVVRDALTARRAGPVTAMHDATEGGVLGGLWEIAEASGTGMEVDARRMLWPDDVDALCSMLEIDPLAAIAEGTLLLTVGAAHAPGVIAALDEEGIPCSEIGRIVADPACRTITGRDGTAGVLARPAEDPFWRAFFAALEPDES